MTTRLSCLLASQRPARHVVGMLVVAACLVASACNGSFDDSPVPQSLDADSAQLAHEADSLPLRHTIDTTTFVVTDSTVTLRDQSYLRPGGRVVNIVITGLDSRLGDPMGHADANHVMRLFLDSGMVEIISIPRDTEADAGFDDTTGFNRLTNVRANRGRNTYHRAIEEITGIGRVDHYIEFGFSQAIGLLELLGYRDNASSALRVLRSRQAYRSGDFQRSYNQGQFIRQVVRKHFDKTEGLVGDLALRAALSLVDTDLTYDRLNSLISSLREGGFDTDERRSWVRLKPTIIARFTVYDFDAQNVSAIDREIDQRIKRLGVDTMSGGVASYERKLASLIQRAAADSAKAPADVIRTLRRSYEQRAWLQVVDRDKRTAYRNQLCALLIASYERTRQPKQAAAIRAWLELDDQVFSAPRSEP
jgi:anionic cell wall polymer biosynthesis LytR-Cps2A-Psr (LCP) family protein